jgi:hypothetical protein
MSDYRIGTGSTAAAGSGTITVSLASTSVSGSSTVFLTEAHVGDLILFGTSIVGSVAVVGNNTSLTLTYGSLLNLAGASYNIDQLTLVSALNADAVDPLGSYYRWMETQPLGDGLERALGRPRAQWYWKNIGVGLRSALLAMIPGKSARVYVRTLVDPNLSTFATYQAAILWPDGDYAYNPDFTFDLRDMIAL